MSARDQLSLRARGEGKFARSLLEFRPGNEPWNLVEAKASVCCGMLIVRFQVVI